MAPTSIEEKFAFLLSCIRWGNNGVIDFKAVAEECKIVSVGAASKRFSRLMKEHGIYQNGSLTGNEGQPVTPKSSKATPTSTPATSGKKRKLDHSTESHDNTGEEDEVAQVKKKSPKKSRKTSTVVAGKKDKGVGMGPAGTNDESMSNDSIAVGEFDGPEEASDVSVKAEEHADEV